MQGTSMTCDGFNFNVTKTKIKMGETTADKYILTDNRRFKVAQFEVWNWWDGKNISGFEIFGHYKGKGLSYGLLDYVTKKLGVKNLAVEKSNIIAKHVYDKFGFEITDEDETFYYMSLLP